MIDFALSLTREPHSVRQENIQRLRDVGFSDEQIVDIVLITCLFKFMDRLADGLGVELNAEMQRLPDLYELRTLRFRFRISLKKQTTG